MPYHRHLKQSPGTSEPLRATVTTARMRIAAIFITNP